MNIRDIQSFETADLELSRGINIIIGPNNSGKSTILKSLYSLQKKENTSLLRKGSYNGMVKCIIEGTKETNLFAERVEEVLILPKDNRISILNKLSKGNVHGLLLKNNKNPDDLSFENAIPFSSNIPEGYSAFDGIPTKEPDNLFYPFFSNRKTISLHQSTDFNNSFEVLPDLRNLVPRFAKLNNSSYPFNEKFKSLCDDILGFGLGIIPDEHSQKLGIYYGSNEVIPLESMGEGVSTILGLITALLVDNNKVFLLEEIENDVHPKALKKLLEFIIEKSANNQFIVSTHSNIVLKYLGSQSEVKIFKTNIELPIPKGGNPTTKLVEVENQPNSRMKVLGELGYDFFDFDLWKGYLILEERSAESIIKDFLIPVFVPSLSNKLRTIEAKGTGNVEATFNDFYRLFVFIHTSVIYKSRAWVVVDGDESGKNVISKLLDRFKLPPIHARNFSVKNFEAFYPKRFEKDSECVLSMPSGPKKSNEKGELAKKVLNWTKENPKEAKEEFEKAALEVILILKEIEAELAKD